MSAHAVARAGCTRRRTTAWLTAMYPVSRALSCRVLSSESCHVALCRITTRPGAAALDRQRYGEAAEDHSQRDSCGAGAKGIDDRSRGVRLQRLQLQGQGVQGTNGLGRPGDFIIRQGKTEQRHPNQTGKHDRQHDMAYCLPTDGTKVMCRFLVGFIEAIEHSEH